jgi:murein DD-endopeptidase MepM/ murein hydrolase activator NlpD
MIQTQWPRYLITFSCLSVAAFIAFRDGPKQITPTFSIKKERTLKKNDGTDPTHNNDVDNDDDGPDTENPESEGIESEDHDLSSEEALEERSAPSFPQKESLTLCLKKGGTLSSLIQQAGFSRKTADTMARKLAKHINLRTLQVGQEVIIECATQQPGQEPTLNSLTLQPNHNTCIFLTLDEKGEFQATKQHVKLTKELVFVEGTVQRSFYQAAFKAGIPSNIIKNATYALSHGVNFKHGVTLGDPFEIAYEVQKNEKNQVVQVGELKYISISPRGKLHQVYYYKNRTGHKGFYTASGESIVRSQFALPFKGKRPRISSHYGYRIHPIKNRRIFHKGVDYAAGHGTPVVAAAAGCVEFANWHGGYGRCVVISHDNSFKTRYGHLSHCNVRVGQYVKQGDVIGRVGATGVASGPHLHYEIMKNGHHTNPLNIKYMPTAKLLGKDLVHFNQYKRSLHTQVAMLSGKASHN